MATFEVTVTTVLPSIYNGLSGEDGEVCSALGDETGGGVVQFHRNIINLPKISLCHIETCRGSIMQWKWQIRCYRA